VDVAVLGVPFDAGRRTAPAPGWRRVRSGANRRSSGPTTTFRSRALRAATVVDAVSGRLADQPGRAYAAIEVGYRRSSPRSRPLVAGRHGISCRSSAPSLAARPAGLVQFDAHIDTWRAISATAIPRLAVLLPWRKAWWIRRFVQVASAVDVRRRGLRLPARKGITVVDIDQVHADGPTGAGRRARLATGRTYVTFDIDAVDPAFAQEPAHRRSGGLTSHQALPPGSGLAGLHVVGADVVEVSPPFDGPGQITSVLAANLLFELLSVMARDVAG